MSMKYVSEYYGVKVKRGGRVKFTFRGESYFGFILSATHYVRVRPENDALKGRFYFHPLDLEYL